MTNISNNLKNIRTEKGLTQQQLADRLFVTRQAVSNWENGKTEPDADTLVKIAQLMDITVNQLIGAYGVEATAPTEKRKIDKILILYISLFVVCLFFRWRPPAADSYCKTVWSNIFATNRQKHLADFLWNSNNILTMRYSFSVGLMEFVAGAMMAYRIKVTDLIPKYQCYFVRKTVNAVILLIMIVNITDMCLPFINNEFYINRWCNLPGVFEFAIQKIRVSSIYPANRWRFILLGVVYELCRVGEK